MDLAELKFKVNTDELADAAKKIEALGTAVSDLNAIQKQSATLNREEAKASKDKVQSDTAQVQAKNKLTEATENSTKASKAAVSETDRLNKLTTNLENTFKDLSKGFTRGESSVLNLARSFGASAEGIDRVKAELAKIGTLIKDPFDAAIGSVRSINQEFDKVTNRTNLAAQGIVLTTKQLSEYSRVATEISAKILSAGLDPTSGKGLADFTKGLERVQQKYLGIAESVNIANNAEKERQRIAKEAQGPTSGSMDQAVGLYYKEQARAMRESSSAAAYLEKEMKRVDFVLNEVNAELQLSTSNRLLKFEESLKRTGVTGTQAASQIEAYRKSLQKIDETRAFKRQTDDLKVYQDKVNYVTRAVGPQLTDIFSGLLTGQQSLYTIAVQQGGQLADQFSLAGIEANKMGGILASALPNMYTNIANIGKAFGQMAIGGFLQLGDTLADISMKTIPFGKNISEAAVKMQMMGETGSTANKMLASGFMIMADTARIASAILATTLIGSIIALGVAAYQVMKEQNELSKALTLTGVSLGMSRDAAVQYAESLKSISGTKAIDVLTEFAKAGVNSSESLEMMIQAAVDLEKYGGVAIADTAKEIKKLQDEPLKALVDLAIATGKVTTETLEKAKAYAKAGDTVALLQLAEEEQARVAIENSGIMRDNLTSLERGVNNVTSAMKYLWEEFKSLARGGPIVDAIATALKLVAKVAVEVFFYVKSIALQMNGLSLLAISAIQDIGSANFDFSATKKAMSEIKTASATIVSERAAAMAQLEGTTKSVVSVTAEVAKAQSEAAKSVKANLDISQELDNKILQSSKKKLTQIEFENQAVEKYRKSLKGLASDETVVAKVRQVAAQEWKDAQTKPKADPAVKLLNQDLEKLTDIKNKALGLNKDYNNSEATLVRLLNQGHINLVEYTLAMSDLNAQQPRAIKLVQEQEKAQRELNKAWEDTVKAQAKNDDEYFKQFDELNKSKVELQNQNAEIDQQYSLLGKTEEQQKLITREYVKQNKLKVAQAELESDLRKITESNASNPESLQLEAYAKNADKIKAINAGVALEFAQDMQREFDSIKATITDAVVTALFDGGKAGSKKLRDAIVAQFRNKITIVVDAVVNTALNSGLSALGLGGTSTGASAGGLAGNIGGGFIKDTILGGTSFGGAMTSGFSMATSGGMGVALEGGLSMLSSATGVQSAMAGLGQIAGALGPIALGVGAIALLAKSFDDSGTMHTGALSQYSATGGAATSQTHGAFGMGFGGVDYSEGAQKLTGEISKSIVTMLDATAVTFGKEAGYKAATAFADDSSGDGAWGGLLIQKLDETIINWDTTRSSKWAPREFSDAEAGQKEYLNAIAADTRNALESIGLPTWATKMLNAVGNAPTLESIAAVVDQINATKVALKSLGEVFPELINISDTAIDNLITVFGGLGNFAASLQSYYSNFYTESEQIERATANTSKAFADLGITMPKVDESLRTWYRGIVDSALALDQGDIANAKATASVLALQGAVNELAPAFDEAVTDIANILEALSTVSNAAYDQLERSVNAEKRTLQFQLDIASTRESIAQAAVDSLKSIFDTLKQSVKELYQEVDSTSAMQVQQARGIIGSAVTSGSVNNIDDLKEAIDTVRSSLDTTSYKTKADQDRARLLLANDLAKLQTSTEVQLTNEEKILAEAKSQVKMLQRQLDNLEDILSTAKEQVDEARNITGAVLSVKDAIAALATALLSERAAIASNAAAPYANAQATSVQNALNATGGIYNATGITSVANTREQEIAGLYQTVLGRTADVSGLSHWANSNLSVSDIGASIAQSLEAQARSIGVDVQNSMIEQVNKSLGLTTDIKAYANGGSYKGGMALVGERGPELINFSQPGQVYTASQTSSMMNGGSNLEELVIKLNENIEGLRFEVRADVSHNSKIAKILDRVSPDGQSLSVTVLA